MSKKLKWTIVVILLFAFVVFFMVTVFQRQYRNVLMEMIIFPEGGCGASATVYRFIVQNDGTLITYVGTSINHCNVARPDILMWPFGRTRAEITLSDEDFRNISEMIFSIVGDHNAPRWRVLSLWEITLLHDGNIYKFPGLELNELADEIVRLSPLMTRWHWHYPEYP